MTKPFPDTAAFTGYDAPSRLETDLYDLEIIGELPDALRGSWYRITPDPQYPPLLGDDFIISGDGMISYFRFADGHVDYRSRYVQTARWQAERTARRALFGAYRNPFTDDESVRGVDRTTANTTALWHGGRLLALKEDGHPYELDPETLATRGSFDFDGKLRSQTMTAHPKIDPQTGELVFFGYEVDGLASRKMAYCVADRNGNLTHEEWFDAPYAALVHDFGVTEDYVIFPVFPTIADLERMKAGGPHWMSDISKDSWVGIMPRRGGVDEMRWFRRPGGFAFHMANAWNDGKRVYLDLALSGMNPFPFIPDVHEPYDPRRAAGMPMRWSFDLARDGDSFEETLLAPVPGDLPRIDDRRACGPYRYTYMGMVDPTRAMRKTGPVGAGFNMVGRLDVHSGETSLWYGDDDCTFQEPQFVPAGPAEDEGYVLAVIERHAENRSDVGVFDARRIADGPIALIRLPHRLRMGVHGNWAPASTD